MQKSEFRCLLKAKVLFFPHDVLLKNDSDFSERSQKFNNVNLFFIILHAFLKKLLTLVFLDTTSKAFANYGVMSKQF